VALKGSLERVFTKQNEPIQFERPTWMQSFVRVIAKLSLTDSSKEAYEKTSPIVGREKELNLILNHLRNAIKGEVGAGRRQTVFVAGPPGTGKSSNSIVSLFFRSC
jgi:hypothetical protein